MQGGGDPETANHSGSVVEYAASDVLEVPVKRLDVRRIACPGPVLKLRDLLDDGETSVEMHVADELARSNVTRFARSRGAVAEAEARDDGTFVVTVTAGEGAAERRDGEEEPLVCDVPTASPGPRVVQVTSTTMGSGDDELGGLLLRSFLKTQLQLERRPDAVIFYNAGVRLCCERSVLLEDLRELERAGIEIIACGTCLNFFGLADELAVGRGSDMLEIAGRLAEAGSIVRP